MSMGTTNDTTVTISNIPIQIELPDQLDNNGLQVFRDTKQTATVTVTGSRAVLGSIGTKDITVSTHPEKALYGASRTISSYRR